MQKVITHQIHYICFLSLFLINLNWKVENKFRVMERVCWTYLHACLLNTRLSKLLIIMTDEWGTLWWCDDRLNLCSDSRRFQENCDCVSPQITMVEKEVFPDKCFDLRWPFGPLEPWLSTFSRILHPGFNSINTCRDFFSAAQFSAGFCWASFTDRHTSTMEHMQESFIFSQKWKIYSFNLLILSFLYKKIVACQQYKVPPSWLRTF